MKFSLGRLVFGPYGGGGSISGVLFHGTVVVIDSEFCSCSVPLSQLLHVCQGDCRTYSYVAGLSSDTKTPNWDKLYTLARIIPRVCININRCFTVDPV